MAPTVDVLRHEAVMTLHRSVYCKEETCLEWGGFQVESSRKMSANMSQFQQSALHLSRVRDLVVFGSCCTVTSGLAYLFCSWVVSSKCDALDFNTNIIQNMGCSVVEDPRNAWKQWCVTQASMLGYCGFEAKSWRLQGIWMEKVDALICGIGNVPSATLSAIVNHSVTA